MSAINVNSITGRTGTHGPVLTGVTTVSGDLIVGSGVSVTGVLTATSFDGTISGNVTGDVTGDVNAGIVTTTTLTGVSTAGIATVFGTSVGIGTTLGNVNNLKYPIILETGTYSNLQRKPGIVFKSTSDNSTLPKNAIFTEEHNSGSELHFATSDDYSTGITTSTFVDEKGRFVSSNATFACAYAPGTQTRAVNSGYVKVQLSSSFSSNVTFDNSNDRLTIIDPGFYHVIAEIQISAPNSGGAYTPNLAIYLNGSSDVNHSYLHEVYNSGYSQTFMISRTRYYHTGDYLELYWQQNTSSTNTFSNQSHLTVLKVV